MRTFTVVLALGAAAVTLHGCGGGGDKEKACVNTKVDFVSQSLKGTTTGDLSLDLPVTSTNPMITKAFSKPITGNLGDGSSFELKFDLEKFQASLTSIDKLKVEAQGLGLTIPADVTAKAIFNVSKKELVLYADASIEAAGSQTHIKNCTVETIDDVPSIEELTKEWDALKPKIQAEFTCKGNDGRLDDFQSAAIPAPISEMVDASADLKMDKDYLWGEIDLNLKKVDVEKQVPVHLPDPVGDITINSIHANGGLTVKVSEYQKGGPTAADLDYSTWDVKCVPSAGKATNFKDLKSVLIAHIMQARARGVAAAVAAAVNQKAELVTV